MTGVETIARIRFEHYQNGKGIKRIARELGVARDTVRKVLRSGATEFSYRRSVQPQPKLGAWVPVLTEILESEAKLPKRERRSTQRLFEELRGRGYDGAHDSVHRFVKAWRAERACTPVQAFIPLRFDPGEAYQFDWSHESIEFAGLPLTVKVAQMRLAYSRMPIVRAYFRETQEMVFDAHDRAFAFYGGACRRGIYDNMKTAVETVFVGRARTYNRRFLQLCSHHLVEPVACTPAAGWEKGQVENQVGTIRDLLFRPKPKVETLDELNAWLADQCIAYARRTRHPELRDRTVWEVFEDERASLTPFVGPFAGFIEKPMRATTTCLVTHDRNRYSVDARAAGRAVLVRVYADRIVVLFAGEMVADHPRSFRREQVVYDAWHYLPVLLRKPGALRNGAPFKDWVLPPALGKVRARLHHHHDGDRQFVKVLGLVPDHGIAAVEEACAEALEAGIASGDVIVAIAARRRQPPIPPSITTPNALRLVIEPAADCARYDALRPKETPSWSGIRSSRP
jgi:transposase